MKKIAITASTALLISALTLLAILAMSLPDALGRRVEEPEDFVIAIASLLVLAMFSTTAVVNILRISRRRSVAAGVLHVLNLLCLAVIVVILAYLFPTGELKAIELSLLSAFGLLLCVGYREACRSAPTISPKQT